MISTIASAYDAAADNGPSEPHLAWRLAWQRMRDDWQRGLRPMPDELIGYLADVPAEDRVPATCDLIAEHLRLSWEAGCGLQLEGYFSSVAIALPGFADVSSLPADLVEDEFLARSTPPHGDQPSLESYAVRFRNRMDVGHLLASRCLADERYVKLRVLGAGALGVVHEAYDRVGKRLVALKEVCRAHPGDGAAERLLDEMHL